MKTGSDTKSLTVPPALLAQLQAAADEEHRPAGEVLRDFIEQGLVQRRARAEILARVDEAEASIARGDGMPITQVSMRQLAADVKQRGRARLDAENAARH